jgi:hypothetical protein
VNRNRKSSAKEDSITISDMMISNPAVITSADKKIQFIKILHDLFLAKLNFLNIRYLKSELSVYECIQGRTGHSGEEHDMFCVNFANNAIRNIKTV